jgi:hypothetical protein
VISNRLTLHRKATKSHVMLTGGGISLYGSVIAKHLTLHRKTTKSHVMLTGGGISPYGIVLRGFTTFHCREQRYQRVGSWSLPSNAVKGSP